MNTKILIKIGGRAFDDKSSYLQLAEAIKSLPDTSVVIVHGGGAEITNALKQANRPTKFIDGIRVTEKEDIAIVERVLSGDINSRITGYLTEGGLPCLGMSGKSGGLLIAEPIARQGQQYGYVGQIKQVNPDAVWQAWQQGRTPVVSPISADEAGNSYNVNADSAAAALAIGAGCTDLLYFTDVPGVKSGDQLLASLSMPQAEQLIRDGVIKDGMVAKMESAFVALQGGVARVHITCWQGAATLKNNLTHVTAFGTTIHL